MNFITVTALELLLAARSIAILGFSVLPCEAVSCFCPWQ